MRARRAGAAGAALALAAVLAALATGCGGGGPPADRLRLAGPEPVTLDPALVADARSARYVVELFSGLVAISPDIEPELDLAAALEVSADGLRYTFTLRDGLRFAGGRALTADDVRWSILRALSPRLDSPVALAYLGDVVGARDYREGRAEGVAGLEVLDARTVRFTLAAPRASFVAKLAYPAAFVVDRERVEADPEGWWASEPNGTGPYRLAEWTRGERLVLRANPRHRLGAPPVAEAAFDLGVAEADELARFEAGELDVARVTAADVARVRDPGGALAERYVSSGQFAIAYLGCNVAAPPCDDANVRRALGLALDRARVAAEDFAGMRAPATGILMPGLPAYGPAGGTLPHDPAEARRLLAASSYGSAANLPPIALTEVVGSVGRIDTRVLAAQWRRELGVEVEVRQATVGEFLATVEAGTHQLFNAGWILDYPDAENVLDLKFHSRSPLNDTGYANAEVDALLERARGERDAEARRALYRRAERLILGDAAWLPLFHLRSHVVVGEDVEGWIEPPMVLPRLRLARLDR